MINSISNTLKILLVSALFITLQLVIFDNLTISVYSYIPIYLLPTITLPIKHNFKIFLILTFIYGIVIDLLSGSNGVVTISLLTIASMKYPIVYLFISKDNLSRSRFIKPAVLGSTPFVFYVTISILIFNAIFVFVDYMGNIPTIEYLKRVAYSTLYATPALVVFQFLIPKRLK